jgi:uncharacterized protein (DUF2225 family)
MVKCPFCSEEFQAQPLKAWRFRFYSVERLQCPSCSGIFNHYSGVRSKGGKSEFVIRVKPR